MNTVNQKIIQAVIDKANSFSHDKKYYCEFTELAEKLNVTRQAVSS